MFETATAQDTWLAGLDAVLAVSAHEPSHLRDLRRQAADRFADLGFPTRRNEEWRFTSVAKIADTPWAQATASAVYPAEIGRWTMGDAHQLVFLDGHLVSSLSSTAGIPDGIVIGSLADAVRSHPDVVTARLGRHAPGNGNAFVALNTALHRDGAFVLVPRGAVVERPIHLLFISSADRPTVSYPRSLVVAGEGSSATVVETYAGAGRYLTCPVTEFAIGQGAVIDHYRLQEEDHEATHISLQHVAQERDSRFSSHSFAFGGALVRNDVDAVLNGEGADSVLNGLYVVGGSQHVDTAMRVRHARPHCTSHEMYKGILDDRARSVFTGRIVVDPDAQKTDAKQSNRNLLLSDGAVAKSNPQLEIFADDVRCTHGSTIGRLDEEAIFYLRSRGISRAAAHSILTHAFAGELVERVRVPSLRARIEERLLERLPGDGATPASA